MRTASDLHERLVGKQFNKLHVLSLEHVQYGAKMRWTYKAVCRCMCGRVVRVYAYALLGGHTGSCGCDKSRYTKMTGSKNYRFKGHGEIRAGFWNGYQASAKERGLPFELTIEQAWQLYQEQGGRCALSGVPIGFGPNRKNSLTTASMDRRDVTKGYVEGNVQWVHKRINIMRNTLPIGEFLHWCQLVVEHAESPCKNASA